MKHLQIIACIIVFAVGVTCFEAWLHESRKPDQITPWDRSMRLPHRPVDALTNWGQGHAPTPGKCPRGTLEFDTEEGLFLECYRGTTP